jgi:hypothetical protein
MSVHDVPPSGEPPAPRLVALAGERSLSPGELELLRFLVDGPGGCEELRVQVAAARVVSECDCGCPSIGLETTGPPVPDAIVRAREPDGREDYFLVAASGPSANADEVEVVLHVAVGRVTELEVWAGTWPGSSPQTELPAVAGLRHRG